MLRPSRLASAGRPAWLGVAAGLVLLAALVVTGRTLSGR